MHYTKNLITESNIMNELTTYAEDMYKHLVRRLHAKLNCSMVPFELTYVEFSERNLSIAHTNYEAVFNGRKDRILKLKPLKIVINVYAIYHLFMEFGVELITTDLIKKTIDVLIAQQLHHNYLYKFKFAETATFKNGRLIMGDLKTEHDCLLSTRRYFQRFDTNAFIIAGFITHVNEHKMNRRHVNPNAFGEELQTFINHMSLCAQRLEEKKLQVGVI